MMYPFPLETISMGKRDDNEKITKRRHQTDAKQYKRTLMCTVLAIMVCSSLGKKFRAIVSHGESNSETRHLRNAKDSNRINENVAISSGEQPKQIAKSTVPKVGIATPRHEAPVEKPAVWPPNDVLDDLFRDSPNSQRRLVVAAANVDFVDFADNFANSLLKVNVTNFVLVPLDEEAYRLLHEAYPKHTLPLTPGLDPKQVHVKNFASKEFKQLTSTRPLFLKLFLEKGYTIFYNDIDMVWTQNAWEALDKLSNSSNNNKGDVTTMLWHDGPGALCSCMLYLMPTPENFSLLTKWQDEIDTNQYKNDQPALNKVAQDMGYAANNKNGTVRVFKNTVQFPHGQKYFGKLKQSPSEETVNNRAHAVIVHNNWIQGKQRKRTRFEEVGLWDPSGKLPEMYK